MILLAIDTGHGSNTAGKRTPDGYREHWINVKTAYYCEQYLLSMTNYIKVLRVAWDDTISTDDEDISLSERQKLINDANCDFSVSMHANAYGDGKTYNSAKGVETLIHSNDAYQNDSLRFAECIQEYIIKGTSQVNRGVKEQSLAMCNCDKMGVKAAALVEIGFMTNSYEAELMMGEAFCKEQGEDVAKGIIAYIEKYYPGETKVDKLYRVRKSWDDAKSQLGAYADLENAKKTCDDNDGYTVYDWNGTSIYGAEYNEPKKLYRVRKSWDDASSQIGAFSVLENAKKTCDDNEGYTVYNWNGEPVYGDEYSSPDQIYRIRKSWDDVRSQVGAYRNLESAKSLCPVGYSVYDENGKVVYAKLDEDKNEDADNKNEDVSDDSNSSNESPKDNTEVPKIISPVYGFTREQFIEYLGIGANKDMERSGILASVTTAQGILESASGQSDLSLYANNIFGMKSMLSGNTWDSDWGGATYTKESPEDDGNGNIIYEKSTFRAYNTIEESIKDHSDYLNGAMNGNKLRYDGLKGETDYRVAVQIIKDGGYATDSKYVDKVCNLIESYNLSQYDFLEEEIEEGVIPSEPEIEDEPIVDTVPEIPEVEDAIDKEEVEDNPSESGDMETEDTGDKKLQEDETKDDALSSDSSEGDNVSNSDFSNDNDQDQIGEYDPFTPENTSKDDASDIEAKLSILETLLSGLSSIVSHISKLLKNLFK